jgi:hypothetical protein
MPEVLHSAKNEQEILGHEGSHQQEAGPQGEQRTQSRRMESCPHLGAFLGQTTYSVHKEDSESTL